MLLIGLYLVTGACWVPVVWLQVRMHRLAETALAAGTALPDRYHRYARCWFWLGWARLQRRAGDLLSHGIQELLKALIVALAGISPSIRIPGVGLNATEPSSPAASRRISWATSRLLGHNYRCQLGTLRPA